MAGAHGGRERSCGSGRRHYPRNPPHASPGTMAKVSGTMAKVKGKRVGVQAFRRPGVQGGPSERLNARTPERLNTPLWLWPLLGAIILAPLQGAQLERLP